MMAAFLKRQPAHLLSPGAAARLWPACVRCRGVAWVAYVDESIRTDDGVYVLAASTLDEDCVDEVRTALRVLKPRRGRRIHWRDEEHADRLAAVSAIAKLPALQTVIIGTPVDPRRQERARRMCLEKLLFDLDAAGVEQVWLETRGTRADRRDIAAVDRFRARQIIDQAIRVDHSDPLAECMLWAADIVAGAISAAEAGEFTFRDQLSAVLTEHRIKLR